MRRLGHLLVVAFATAAIAPALPYCSTAQWSDVLTQTQASDYFGPCKADVGLPDATNAESLRLTSSQVALARDSENCQWLFGHFQSTASALSHSCFELTLVTTSTYELFLSYVDIKATYPPTQTRCNTTQVREATLHSIMNSNNSDCLSAAGLNATVALDHLPTLHQLAVLRITDQCGLLFADLQHVVGTLPTCAMFNEGTPIQAIAHLSLDTAVGWLEVLTPYVEPWTSQTTDTSVAIEFPRNHMQLAAGVLLAAMLAGTGFVIGVYVLYSNHRLRSVMMPVEEELRLLAQQAHRPPSEHPI
ncbi:hypothetical protein H310_02490 [Aphanomyces invadans]|uniref:Uncharacterized protein n=1 Tax=Aphanomyces invadans TaxID=157072 RepID=A0A024UPN5_9STRA|nr:hypothetical protein H310_02490 [Aphanomyces invadans]ETW08150.1 hypothetical protein H310_02490 [Aphanomyces invadans]|eukprot:XP_008864243.1 hypothetical protein H310_02490 [Aphanomyces invadans]